MIMKKSCFDGVRKALSVNLPGIPFISKWLVPIHRLYLLLCCITKEEANDHTKNLLSILCFPGRSCCPANRPHSHWMPGFTCRPEIFTTIQQNISAWDESLPDTMLFFFSSASCTVSFNQYTSARHWAGSWERRLNSRATEPVSMEL